METQKEMNFNTDEIITRNPRLDTIIMVEKFIKENSGEYKKTELLNKLPKKMMWGTFNVVLQYLYDNPSERKKMGANGKAAIDKEYDWDKHVFPLWNDFLLKILQN